MQPLIFYVDQQEMVTLLNGSLIGPLEDWQKFELLLALKMSEALANATGYELILRPIGHGSSLPIAIFGPFEVYWQNRSQLFRNPDPEPSEVVVAQILHSYGVRAGADRPDIVICDRVNRVVVAIAEAKFSTSRLTGEDAFREAVSQLVRYSRLYTECVPQGVLLRRSLVAVSNVPDEIRDRSSPGTAPFCVSLKDLQNDNLVAWTRQVTSSYSSGT